MRASATGCRRACQKHLHDGRSGGDGEARRQGDGPRLGEQHVFAGRGQGGECRKALGAVVQRRGKGDDVGPVAAGKRAALGQCGVRAVQCVPYGPVEQMGHVFLPLGVADALVERAFGQPVLQLGKLVEQRTGEGVAEVGHRGRDLRPYLALAELHRAPALGRQRNDALALVVAAGPGPDHAELDELADGARGARLGDAHGRSQLADGQRPQPVESAEKRVVAGMEVFALGVGDAGGVGLQALADALEAGAEHQIAHRADDIFGHADSRTFTSYITRYIT